MLRSGSPLPRLRFVNRSLGRSFSLPSMRWRAWVVRFKGVLYAGLMIVKGTPYVLGSTREWEIPKPEVVLPLLQTDLLRSHGGGG